MEIRTDVGQMEGHRDDQHETIYVSSQSICIKFINHDVGFSVKLLHLMIHKVTTRVSTGQHTTQASTTTN